MLLQRLVLPAPGVSPPVKGVLKPLHARLVSVIGRETHGLMNYPFRTAALAYLQGGGAEDFMEAMETIRENYPRPAFYSAMNLLGTHRAARRPHPAARRPPPPGATGG